MSKLLSQAQGTRFNACSLFFVFQHLEKKKYLLDRLCGAIEIV